MEILLEKFQTESEFRERRKDGFVASQWRDRRKIGQRFHESDCWTLSLPGDENHVSDVYDKYWSPDLELLRRIWPDASECQHCIGRALEHAMAAAAKAKAE
jgi:hypothetical protein